MLGGNIDGSDQDLQQISADLFSPKAISALIAETAREALAEAEAINAGALGAPVPYETTVDGRPSGDFDSVRPDGVIVGTFDLTAEALAWIEAQLILHSPVRTGRYQKSHRMFVDGEETSLANIPPGAKRIVFAPISSYAPEIEPHGGRPGESRKAPDGVYQAVAVLARARYGNVANISFAYLAVPGIEQPLHRAGPSAEPAIIFEV